MDDDGEFDEDALAVTLDRAKEYCDAFRTKYTLELILAFGCECPLDCYAKLTRFAHRSHTIFIRYCFQGPSSCVPL